MGQDYCLGNLTGQNANTCYLVFSDGSLVSVLSHSGSLEYLKLYAGKCWLWQLLQVIQSLN